LNTVSGWEAIFTFAMASMFSGMFPFENALATEISMGMVSRLTQSTVSMMGIRRVRPPITERYPTRWPSNRVRVLPVMTAASLGGTMTMSD
jgi:hypothetical protein